MFEVAVAQRQLSNLVPGNRSRFFGGCGLNRRVLSRYLDGFADLSGRQLHVEGMLFGDVEDYVLGHEGLKSSILYRHRVTARRKVRDIETPAAAGGHGAHVSAGFLAVNHDGRAGDDGATGIGDGAGEGCRQLLSETGGRQAENDQATKSQTTKERLAADSQNTLTASSHSLLKHFNWNTSTG